MRQKVKSRVPFRHFGGAQRRADRPAVKVDPEAITDAMYRQDIAPFQESFDVLAKEMARVLPRWADRIGHGKPAERAALFLRTMRNAVGFSQTALGEKAGIKQSDISALETGSGKQGPTFDVVERIADACGFYVTFAAKAEANKAAAPEHVAGLPRAPRVLRTYVMEDDGELNEFEGTSPPLKNRAEVIVDDSVGHTYKVIVNGRGAKVAIEEVEAGFAAAVHQAQSFAK